MGIFSSPQQRNPYVPSFDRSDDASTFLGGASLDRLMRPLERDPNLVPASNDMPAGPETQMAQSPLNTLDPPPGPVSRPANPQFGATPSQKDQPQPRRGVAPSVEPLPGGPDFEAGMKKAVGYPVVLPDGSKVLAPKSDTGYLMSPSSDLGPVATAGHQARREFQALLNDPDTAPSAVLALLTRAGINVGQGGVYDYQREGNHITGFVQYPHFRGVSNFNVGLFCQQAGMSLEEILAISGTFARAFSSNADRSQPYGLDRGTAEFIKLGFEAGKRGAFEPPGVP